MEAFAQSEGFHKKTFRAVVGEGNNGGGGLSICLSVITKLQLGEMFSEP